MHPYDYGFLLAELCEQGSGALYRDIRACLKKGHFGIAGEAVLERRFRTGPDAQRGHGKRIRLQEGDEAVSVAHQGQGIFDEFAPQDFRFGGAQLFADVLDLEGVEAGEAEAVLGTQHTAHAFHHLGAFDAAVGQIRFDFAQGGTEVFGQHDDIVAG